MRHVLFWVLVLVVWIGGALGIAAGATALFETKDAIILASMLGGFLWGYLLTPAALYVWEEYVD